MTDAIPTAEEIAAIRQRLGLTVREFAQALGLTTDRGAETVRFLEKGTRRGEPYQMSGPQAAALRYLLAIKKCADEAHYSFEASDLIGALHDLRKILPEKLQT